MRTAIFIISLIVKVLTNNDPTSIQVGNNVYSFTLDVNNEVDNINNGGCGYYAMKLYEYLDTSRYSLVSIGRRTHICVLDNKYTVYIDSEGYHSFISMAVEYRTLDFKPISYSHLRWMVYNLEWNKMFDQRDTTKIDKYFKSILWP